MPPDRDTVVIVVASRINWKTSKYDVAWFDDEENPHLIGSFETILEAEFAATEYVIERVEGQLAEMRMRAERLRLEIEAAKSNANAPPKVFMPPSRRTS